MVNLGTPDSPTTADVRRYLRTFLMDRRVVDLPAALWRPILELIILRVRPAKSAAKYASIWTPDGSPLLVHSRRQRDGLQARLADVADVRLAMLIGQPSLMDVLDQLLAAKASALIVPMYPQYSTTTVASVRDAVEAWQRRLPERHMDIDWLPEWFDDDGYIEACAHRIEAAWQTTGRPDFAGGDKLLLSFHGLPVSVARRGDPYAGQCQTTAEHLRARLGLTDEQCPMTFQSKFGPGAWLTPATIETVTELGQAGVRRLDVFCPGFAVDCLETDEEIGLLNRDAFLRAGGVEFHKIDCLNDAPVWLDALARLIGM